MTWPTSFTLHARLKLDSGVNGQSSGVMSKAAVKEEKERKSETEREKEREKKNLLVMQKQQSKCEAMAFGSLRQIHTEGSLMLVDWRL